ncbi:MAG TPA: AAA family ATPase [Candidatus Limnocylindrales bacterium]|nr:AAA family ATPase [Candidatus Limnocylindrales bacterium]
MSAALFERDQVLAELRRSMQSAARGHGSFIVVEGGVGLGKTSVLAEARRIAQEQNYIVLSAQAPEMERGLPFGVVRQLFQPRLMSMSPPQRRKVFSGAASRGAAVLGWAAEGRQIGDFANLHGLFWLTANLCPTRPLALVCDDLHWTDEASLRYLAYLVPRLENMRLLVVAASRPNQHGAAADLLARITADPACVSHPLAPLGLAAGSALARGVLGPEADPQFLAACHAATGGNPMFLHELAAALLADDVRPTASNVKQVNRLGACAISRRVESWLARLPADGTALARAIAVLGGEAHLRLAAEVADLPLPAALAAADALGRLECIQHEPNGSPDLVGFVHPLVSTAVYQQMSLVERAAWHRKAATALAGSGAEPERVATQLLGVHPAGDPNTVETLRRAATTALARGAPESALGYLRRCLAEPPGSDQEATLLVDMGTVAAEINLPAAADYLTRALVRCPRSERRAWIGYQLGRVQFGLGRYAEAWKTYQRAVACLPSGDGDLHRRLYAGMVSLGLAGLRHPKLAGLIDGWRRLESDASLGSHMLNAVLATFLAIQGDPGGVSLAERGLDNVLVERATSDMALACGWWTLLVSDQEPGMRSLDASVAQAHQIGSHCALGASLTWRGLGWLCRGHLTEAIDDLRRAVAAADTAHIVLARQFSGPWLADALIERGELEAADAALAWVAAPNPLPPSGPWYLYLDSRARLMRARGRHLEALHDARSSGRYFEASGGVNPAFVAWRTEAALALHALGCADEARVVATEELDRARRWGAPRTLGRALRLVGGITGGRAGADMLREAIDVLESGSAKLELAKALAAHGSLQRRLGHLVDARTALRRALDLADTLSAALLVDQIKAEIKVAGGRPRRSALTGLRSLTPSERRVANLAAAGHSNRQIAEQLFVTPKTVEVHLSACYRKLGVTRRNQLLPALRA